MIRRGKARYVLPWLLLLLVACGAPNGGAPPVGRAAPTQTRAAELAQLATLTAPTATAIPTATPAATPTPNLPNWRGFPMYPNAKQSIERANETTYVTLDSVQAIV